MPGRTPYRQIIDGVPRSPSINPEVFRMNQSFRATEGDVVQSQYAKSGTNWVQYITQLIIKHDEVINYAEFTRDFRAIEYMDCADWKPTLPVRLFVTHLPLRRETMNEKAKYIYVARNPWDVCVSTFRMMADVNIYRFQDGKFEDFVEPFMKGDLGYGDYFDHVASGYALKDEPNVFFLTYEELKMDTRSTVLRLAHFLGEDYGRALEEDEQVLQNVLVYSKAENMRKVIVHELQGCEVPEWNNFFTGQKITCKHGYGGDESKFSIVKEARVGSWKDHFTPEQLARFEKKIQEKGDKASFMQLWSSMREEAIALSRTSP
ncbi:3-alpha-hydroxysteroid sulfotransferase-like [Amblyomma americanum]